MMQFRYLGALMIALALTTRGSSYANHAPSWNSIFADDIVALPSVAYVGSGCGDEAGCLNAQEHKMKEGTEYNTTHGCEGPETHSGPKCGVLSLSVEQVREMDYDAVKDYVASTLDPNIILNERHQSVDVLSCGRSVIVGRIPFAHLGED